LGIEYIRNGVSNDEAFIFYVTSLFREGRSMKRKEFSCLKKDEILETLKEIYSSSDKVTYKQLEEIQKQKYGGVAYKWSTLRNKASLEGWNRKKGAAAAQAIEEKKSELIALVEDEEVEILEGMEKDQYIKIVQGIGKKYKNEFSKVKVKLRESIDREDLSGLKYVEAAVRTIRSARKLDLELLGVLDVEEQRRLEVELLRVELLAVEKTSKG
jgi:hypothetical protein